MDLINYSRTPASPCKEVRIDKWVLFFIDADSYFNAIDTSESVNMIWRKYEGNLVKISMNNKLFNIGHNDDPVKDFERFVRKDAASSFRMHRGATYALIFDCNSFSHPSHFDKIILAHRANINDPFRYYCMNTLKLEKEKLRNCDCEDKKCAKCTNDSPSNCVHNCLEKLIAELSS